MPYEVDLTPRVEDALVALSDDGRREVMETIAKVRARPEVWPAPGGRDGAAMFGTRSWVLFTSYARGIEVYDIGSLA